VKYKRHQRREGSGDPGGWDGKKGGGAPGMTKGGVKNTLPGAVFQGKTPSGLRERKRNGEWWGVEREK